MKLQAAPGKYSYVLDGEIERTILPPWDQETAPAPRPRIYEVPGTPVRQRIEPTLTGRTLAPSARYQERQKRPCESLMKSFTPRMSPAATMRFRAPACSPARNPAQLAWAYSCGGFPSCQTPSIRLTKEMTPSYPTQLCALSQSASASLKQETLSSSASDSRPTSLCSAHQETVGVQDRAKESPARPACFPAAEAEASVSTRKDETRGTTHHSATDPRGARPEKPVHAREEDDDASCSRESKRLCSRTEGALSEPGLHAGGGDAPSFDCQQPPGAGSMEKTGRQPSTPCTGIAQPSGECMTSSVPPAKESECDVGTELPEEPAEKRGKEALAPNPPGEPLRRKKGFCAAREIVQLLSG